LRAKFTNYLNFFVREVGRGSGVLEHSLEIAEVLRGGGKTGSQLAHILEKGSGKFISSVFKLATNKTLGYDMLTS